MAVWWLMVCHFLHLPGNTGSTQQQGEHAVGVSNRLPSCTCRSWSRASTGSARRGRGRRHGQKVSVVRFVACMYVGAAVVMQSQFCARGSARLLRREVAGPTWYQRLSTSSIDISRQLPSCVSFLAVCRRPWLPPHRGTRSLRGGRRLVGCRRLRRALTCAAGCRARSGSSWWGWELPPGCRRGAGSAGAPRSVAQRPSEVPARRRRGGHSSLELSASQQLERAQKYLNSKPAGACSRPRHQLTLNF